MLPLAAIEQHGEHLPLSTDLDIALGLLEAAVPKLRAGLPLCVLPPVAVGDGGFAGLLDADGQPADAAYMASRQERLLAAYADLAPDVVITEALSNSLRGRVVTQD